MRLIWILILAMMQSSSFKTTQMQYVRVKNAYQEKEATVKKYFEDKHLQYAQCKIFLRAFKSDGKLEVWAKDDEKQHYTLLHSYDICSRSGVAGPKRKEGDLQVPEGIYTINHFNPQSNFHLSLGIDYPNASDRILSDRKNPGSAIYVHGNCVTIGCIPITDDKIKELYVLAVEAHNNGQKNIPIHIFPTKLDDASLQSLIKSAEHDVHLSNFWKNLQTVYKDFESTHMLRKVHVNQKGEYHF